MQCLHCGKKLGYLRKLGGKQFCSEAHEKKYNERRNDLALARLLEEAPAECAAEDPKPEPLAVQPRPPELTASPEPAKSGLVVEWPRSAAPAAAVYRLAEAVFASATAMVPTMAAAVLAAPGLAAGAPLPAYPVAPAAQSAQASGLTELSSEPPYTLRFSRRTVATNKSFGLRAAEPPAAFGYRAPWTAAGLAQSAQPMAEPGFSSCWREVIPCEFPAVLQSAGAAGRLRRGAAPASRVRRRAASPTAPQDTAQPGVDAVPFPAAVRGCDRPAPGPPRLLPGGRMNATGAAVNAETALQAPFENIAGARLCVPEARQLASPRMAVAPAADGIPQAEDCSEYQVWSATRLHATVLRLSPATCRIALDSLGGDAGAPCAACHLGIRVTAEVPSASALPSPVPATTRNLLFPGIPRLHASGGVRPCGALRQQPSRGQHWGHRRPMRASTTRPPASTRALRASTFWPLGRRVPEAPRSFSRDARVPAAEGLVLERPTPILTASLNTRLAPASPRAMRTGTWVPEAQKSVSMATGIQAAGAVTLRGPVQIPNAQVATGVAPASPRAPQVGACWPEGRRAPEAPRAFSEDARVGAAGVRAAGVMALKAPASIPAAQVETGVAPASSRGFRAAIRTPEAPQEVSRDARIRVAGVLLLGATATWPAASAGTRVAPASPRGLRAGMRPPEAPDAFSKDAGVRAAGALALKATATSPAVSVDTRVAPASQRAASVETFLPEDRRAPEAPPAFSEAARTLLPETQVRNGDLQRLVPFQPPAPATAAAEAVTDCGWRTPVRAPGFASATHSPVPLLSLTGTLRFGPVTPAEGPASSRFAQTGMQSVLIRPPILGQLDAEVWSRGPQVPAGPGPSHLVHPVAARGMPWTSLWGKWNAAPTRYRRAAWAVPALAAAAFALHMGAPAGARSLETMKGSLEKRSLIELEDDFRFGLSRWEGASDWAKDWKYDPAGFLHPGRSLALLTESRPLDGYTLEFLGQIDQKALSWVIRAANLRNYYVFKILVAKPGPLPLVVIQNYSVLSGVAGTRRQLPLPIQVRSDTLYRVRMAVQGEQFTTFVNGQLVDTWSDSRLRTGGVGFFSERGEAARLRWVRVTRNDDLLGRLCSQLFGGTRR